MAIHFIAAAAVVFLLESVHHTSAFVASPNCPPSESILPCTCAIKDTGANVICARMSSYDALRRAINEMRGFKLNSFVLKESSVKVLPSDTFINMEIRSLRIAFVQPTVFDIGPGPAFVGLEGSLEELEIHDSFRFSELPFPRIDLSHLKHLKSLTLESVEIPEIDNSFFSNGPRGLEHLHLRTTHTKKFGDAAFASLINLKELSIYQEQLKNLTRDMLPTTALRLTSLILSNNHLTELPSNIFHRFPSIQRIHIEMNALNTIDISTWGQIWPQLTDVNFYGNPIQCDQNIKWIYEQQLPNIFSGICVSPDNLRNRELKSLTLDDFK